MFKDPDFKANEGSADYKRIRNARPSVSTYVLRASLTLFQGFAKVLERMRDVDEEQAEDSSNAPRFYEVSLPPFHPLPKQQSSITQASEASLRGTAFAAPKKAKKETMTLRARLQAQPEDLTPQTRRRTGGMELSFVPHGDQKNRKRKGTPKAKVALLLNKPRLTSKQSRKRSNTQTRKKITTAKGEKQEHSSKSRPNKQKIYCSARFSIVPLSSLLYRLSSVHPWTSSVLAPDHRHRFVVLPFLPKCSVRSRQ